MSVGVLVVSYGSRAASMVDALMRSSHDVDLYIADKQKNPFNAEHAKEHAIIPDLSVQKIAEFAAKHKNEIEFGLVGSEAPIIAGVRDTVYEKTGITMLCPTREYAIEESKLAQRILLDECYPTANPRYKAFDPVKNGSYADVEKNVINWFEELDHQVVVKPDKPGFGKGVGVWGDHYDTQKDFLEYFRSNYESGATIIEEKINGEESSFQAFCDGKTLVPLPDTRDYKRAFDGDIGPNTGGMGSYSDTSDKLPFMSARDREMGEAVAWKIFARLRGDERNEGLLGMPFYFAFMHTKGEPKILEINSRPGDPECMNVMVGLDSDFVDVCYAMLEGKLKKVKMKPKATVVTYKVPPTYGGFDKKYPRKVAEKEVGGIVDLNGAYELVEKTGGAIRVYPGSMEIREDGIHSLKSRAVACVGLGDSIEAARENSLKGLSAIKGGALWHRSDVASASHIKKSVEHMNSLRC
ncbi:MAG: hypothetical protein ABH834_03955 [Candidatus Altiarchaeota archaeon]